MIDKKCRGWYLKMRKKGKKKRKMKKDDNLQKVQQI